MKVEWSEYDDQLQFGILFARHKHYRDDYYTESNLYHYHIFILSSKRIPFLQVGDEFSLRLVEYIRKFGKNIKFFVI